MSVDLPAHPSPLDVPVIVFGLQEQSLFAYDGGDLLASMGHCRYSGIVVVSGEGALKGAAEGIRGTVGVSNVSYTTRQVGEGEFALDGKFVKDGKDYNLRGRSFVKGQNAWFICIFYYSSNKRKDRPNKMLQGTSRLVAAFTRNEP